MKILQGLLACLFMVVAVAFAAPQDKNSVPSKAELRRQLADIDLYKAKSIETYLDRISAVERLVPDLEHAYEIADRHFAEAQRKNVNNPKMLRVLRAYMKLNWYDKEGFKVLKEEIRKAKWLQDLPSDKKQAYFDAEITPLRSRQIEIAKQEIRYAKDMQKQGLALPGDVNQSLR